MSSRHASHTTLALLDRSSLALRQRRIVSQPHPCFSFSSTSWYQPGPEAGYSALGVDTSDGHAHRIVLWPMAIFITPAGSRGRLGRQIRLLCRGDLTIIFSPQVQRRRNTSSASGRRAKGCIGGRETDGWRYRGQESRRHMGHRRIRALVRRLGENHQL